MQADWRHWVAAALLALAGQGAMAEEPCGGGIGGTGAPLAAQADDGKGGGSEPVGGIGGTGIVADLAPGEAGRVIGTIVRFGSICVNGLRIAYDLETPTERDGRDITAADLQVGQVARVDVESTDGRLEARHITLLSSVTGVVTARDEGARAFQVLGQPVQLGPDTWIGLSGTAVPAVGTSVRVSGLVAPDGTVAASRLESTVSVEPEMVMARLTELDGRYAAVGAVRVEFPVGKVPAGIAIGDELAVRGRWNGEALEAETVVVAPRDVAGVRAASLEGFLHACGNGDALGLDGHELAFRAFAAPRAWLGRRVVVEGRQREDGVFEAVRILPSPFAGASPGSTAPLRCTARPAPAG